MKTLLTIGMALFTLTACDPSKDTSTQAPAPAATAPASAPAQPETPAPVSAASAYEFAFSFKDGKVSLDPRIVRMENGPCGESPVAEVATMPLTDAILLPDFVVEFDATGREIKRWGKPYDSVVLGLDGDRLQFRTGGDQAFWTDPTGAVGTLDSAPSSTFDAPLIECPALPTFAKSDYEQCYDIAGTGGSRRTLAWEGACT